MTGDPVPVIDVFAGPGGLGEGFSSLKVAGKKAFDVALSVEADAAAHQTLRLRTFFRSFSGGRVPDAYYDLLRQQSTQDALFGEFRAEAAEAGRTAWRATLGADDLPLAELDRRVIQAVGAREHWVLVGGPPCQAYSIAGRSRNSGKRDYRAADDHRHYLYREYLRILREYWPPVFVIENVKGLLTAKVGGESMFSRILEDLQDPARALGGASSRRQYRIYSLSRESAGFDLFGVSDHAHVDYLVDCEKYGVPQARQRVLLLGVLNTIQADPQPLTVSRERPAVRDVLSDLPRLRSGLTREEDSAAAWKQTIQSVARAPWVRSSRARELRDVCESVLRIAKGITVPRRGRGGEFVPGSAGRNLYQREWYADRSLGGVCNHETRNHMPGDLHRYLFASCFARVVKRSPLMRDFPEALRPNHNNVEAALGHGNFNDRFKVQLVDWPASTIVSHIAKDGHYYIHPDPSQCRSLTVREAARLQTFPDNYFFCGNRTEQYVQVGNAVPPLLARQIAEVVHRILQSGEEVHATPQSAVRRDSNRSGQARVAA